MNKLIQELQRRQSALLQAEVEVKRFERLEEIDRDAFNAAKLRREQAVLDDRTMSRFVTERNQWS